MDTKKCFKCGVEKSIEEFYKHPRMKDGHLNKCIECTVKDVHLHRIENKEKLAEYERKRNSDPKRKKAVARTTVNWQRDNPEKVKAQNAVGNAVRDGRLTKPKCCEICGKEEKLHGHHTDYSNPLIVVWLCVGCHASVR